MIHPASVFQRIKVVVPPVLEAIYSNAAVVRYSADEFMIDFTRLLPGIARPRVAARVSMTPFNASLFREALRDRLARHEHDYGTIRLTAELDGGSGSNTPSGPRQGTPKLPPPRSQKSNGQQPAPASAGQDVDIPAGLEVIYSNFAVVRSCAVDVVIDFACLPPNVFRTDICARLVVSPAGAKLLLQTLAGALDRFEEKHGRVEPPKNIGGEENGDNAFLTLWGPPVPFALN